MPQRPYKVTAVHVISLPDGTDAAPGAQVVCDDRAARPLVALGHLTAAQIAPAPKTAPSTRDAVAEHVPDKE
jgi:hypothetical protein